MEGRCGLHPTFSCYSSGCQGCSLQLTNTRGLVGEGGVVGVVEAFGCYDCQGHSTLSSERVFEGTWLTQLVQLVTASRLFLGHKGQVDL